MSVNENAIALRFADRATAYRALGDLRYLSPATTEVRGAVLVERLADGEVRLPEGAGLEEWRNTAAGSLVDSLVNTLSGPLGAVMGLGVGALIGGGHDGAGAARATSAVSAFVLHVPPHGTAILAEVKEHDPQALDLLAMRYDAVLERRPADSIRAELKAMEEAADQDGTREPKQAKEDAVAAAHAVPA
ncbi:hypothetical protein [Streptomyces blattellae]|uniref:hypothetical protein n=1 Tax=Streptomyces blattellae TaxID=2569855 RepID=UPI0012B87DD0|nr:hypothetical protein [Streptomyces blattellae]